MTTPYVARCSVCGVAPFSENDPKGLGYTLKRFPDGELYCEAHYPPKRRAPPPTAVTPRDALDDLEKRSPRRSKRSTGQSRERSRT